MEFAGDREIPRRGRAVEVAPVVDAPVVDALVAPVPVAFGGRPLVLRNADQDGLGGSRGGGSVLSRLRAAGSGADLPPSLARSGGLIGRGDDSAGAGAGRVGRSVLDVLRSVAAAPSGLSGTRAGSAVGGSRAGRIQALRDVDANGVKSAPDPADVGVIRRRVAHRGMPGVRLAGGALFAGTEADIEELLSTIDQTVSKAYAHVLSRPMLTGGTPRSGWGVPRSLGEGCGEAVGGWDTRPDVERPVRLCGGDPDHVPAG